jgi:hypothetical protein
MRVFAFLMRRRGKHSSQSVNPEFHRKMWMFHVGKEKRLDKTKTRRAIFQERRVKLLGTWLRYYSWDEVVSVHVPDMLKGLASSSR